MRTSIEIDDFFTKIDGLKECETYTHVSTHEQKKPTRKLVNSIWKDFRHYCPDRNFIIESRTRFNERIWELLVFGLLTKNGFKLEPVKDVGPDFMFYLDGKRIWVEAICPTQGDAGDRVPDQEFGQVMFYSDEPYIKRYLSALTEKNKKIKKYIEKGIIESGDAVVIAVSGAHLPNADLNFNEAPVITKTVYPIGRTTFSVEIGSGKVTDNGHSARSFVSKSNGNTLDTVCFLTPEFENISGILYCANHIVHLDSIEAFAKQSLFIHNLKALNSIKRGTFNVGREFWAEDKDSVLSLHESRNK